MLCFDPARGLTKECFESVLQSMAEGLLIVDQSGIIRFCNNGLEKMSGLPAGAIIGKRCHDIMVCAGDSMKECTLLTSGTLSNPRIARVTTRTRMENSSFVVCVVSSWASARSSKTTR